MFNIKQLLLALSIFSIALLFSSLLLGRYWWFYPKEEAQFIEQQQYDLDSINATLDLISDEILQGAQELAQNPELIQALQQGSNLPSIIEKDSWQLASALIVDRSMEVSFLLTQNAVWQPRETAKVDFLNWFEPYASKNLIFNQSPKKDIIKMGASAYYLIAHPLFTAKNSEPIAWVVLLRKFDTELKNYFEYLTHFKIDRTETTQESGVNIADLKTPIDKAKKLHKRCLYDQNNQPVLCYTLEWKLNNLPVFLDIPAILVYSLAIVIPVTIFSLFVSFIIKPLQQATRFLKRNNNATQLKPLSAVSKFQIEELEELRLAYNQLINVAIEQRNELEKRSNTDKLTQIANRNAFDEILKNTWQQMCRRSESVALVLVDIDHFKLYNDHYGHLQGDKALYQVAQALKGCARRVNEITARFGGEEFVLIIYADNETQLHKFAAKLQHAIHELHIPHAYSSAGTELSVSAGIAWIKHSGLWLNQYSSTDWLKLADTLLYSAKNKGRKRNEIAIYEGELPSITEE